MFRSISLPVPHVTGHFGVKLPVRVLLAIPEYVNEEFDPAPFNVLDAIDHLMGGHGWERAVKVMEPSVWAPGWDDEKFRQVFASPFGASGRSIPPRIFGRLRVREFPASRARLKVPLWSRPVFDVVHFTGAIPWWGFADSCLALQGEGRAWVGFEDVVEGRAVPAGELRDALVWCGTRLLILQVRPAESQWAERLGAYIAGGGGPAVLVVVGGDAEALQAYFTSLYAGIIHNQFLGEVARPMAYLEERLNVTLYLGEGGEEILKFDRLLATLADRIDALQEMIVRADDATRDVLAERGSYLHSSQLKALEARPLSTPDGPQILQTISQLNQTRASINWARESGGAIPLSELIEALPQIERVFQHGAIEGDPDVFYSQIRDQLSEDIKSMARQAPRVLNSNFADPRTGRVLEPRQAMTAGREYDLMVDVGPVWSKAPSIVTGNSEFPESALPPDDEGYVVKMVLISDDFTAAEPVPDGGVRGGLPVSGDEEPETPPESFEVIDIEPPETEGAGLDDAETPGAQDGGFRPCLLTRWIWVPRQTGRSFPFVNGVRAEKAGPILLRVVAPEFPEGTDERFIVARGRLCLYYRNNLLQSAAVEVGVGRTPDDVQPNRTNRVHVDYVLTGSFRELEQFETRTLRSESGEQSSYGVGLNLTLNGDGAGGHRIILEEHSELTVSRPYDPAASSVILDATREKLKECFGPRDDATCRVDEAKKSAGVEGLDAENGKTLRQFKCDLWWLARHGFELYTKAFAQLNVPDWPRWSASFDAALEKRTVIQVARTGLAQYVYPWALLYDIPLPDRNVSGGLRWCEVIEKEWSGFGGRREGKPAEACPYRHTPEHRKNTICPYGFWGLKHYIEQPINVAASSQPDGEAKGLDRDVLRVIKAGRRLEFGVGVTRDALLDAAKINAHLQGIKKLSDYMPADGADDWLKVQHMLASPQVVYFLCHGEFDRDRAEPYLGVGLRDSDQRHRVYPTELTGWARTLGASFWQDQHPLIFINGCHTGDLRPGEVLNFVKTFADFGASAVIGTEISIRLPLAVEVAEQFFGKLLKGASVGHAMHEVRWELANKGNLLGLAYTPYCFSELHIARDGADS
jgi:hypothetical protein